MLDFLYHFFFFFSEIDLFYITQTGLHLQPIYLKIILTL